MAETRTSKRRYLTKSRYKLATECPAKLYYTGKPEYADKKIDDIFMQTLAEGGFQVGALAKLYFPGGVEISAIDNEEAVLETDKLLKKDKVTIYEAGVKYGNCFIRADILVKRGDHIDLIEVKAKSVDMTDEEDQFKGKKGRLNSGWLPYLRDVAFQKYVLSHAFPKYEVSAYLMLADKTAVCPTDGLNQKFKLYKDKNGRKKVRVSASISEADLSPKILIQVAVDEYCGMIYEGTDTKKVKTLKYEDELKWYSGSYEKDEKIDVEPSTKCAKCEFKATPEDKANGLKSGFEECWMKTLGWEQKDFEEPTVLDIWAIRKDKLLQNGQYKMKQVNKEDISPEPDGRFGKSQSEREWLQVEKVKKNDNSIWVADKELKSVMDKFNFPLHFIDFETMCAAIPFTKGRRPYEQVAFQFSHHIVKKDGSIEHTGQYINAEPGVFPNYEFVRELKKQLSSDDGSIFMFAIHENTVLCEIHEQLKADTSGIPDKEELIKFIKSVTLKKLDKDTVLWKGDRKLIDLRELVVRFYYDPYTNGSNSLKDVLPAVLKRSEYLKKKYSKPIYGAKGGIPSKNFTDKQWLQIKNGEVIDPYKQLPRLFEDHEGSIEELLSDSDELRAGGAAATAYGKLQFVEMTDYERNALKTALLKYCELDTLAMVMLYECWKDLLKV